MQFTSPEAVMRRALELAAQGRGHVEPNPMVGAVLVDDQWRLLGEGWHERHGGPHAEVRAIEAAGSTARGARLFVTLEPCRHFGKTPPCTHAVLKAGIARVDAAMLDPFSQVAGGGARELEQAGVPVAIGLCEAEARELNAPYLKLLREGRPWVHAKWAMTLDGQIAAYTGHSRWITNHAARQAAHRLRSGMDAIIIGIGTALADDPLLTVRLDPPPVPVPAGQPSSAFARVPWRIVLDSMARLPLASQLVQTCRDVPLVVCASDAAPAERLEALSAAGVQVWPLPTVSAGDQRAGLDVITLLGELGQRRMTHVLVEGGRALLGQCFTRHCVDELHVFVAPKMVLGDGQSPLAGRGLATMPEAATCRDMRVELLGDNVYWHGRLAPVVNQGVDVPA